MVTSRLGWLALPLALLAALASLAQSVPIGPITNGQVWTPAQWNAAWSSKVDYPVTGQWLVSQGGSGAASFTAHGVLLGEGTSAFGVTGVGTSGYCLTSNGSGSDPTFQACGSGGVNYGIIFNGQEVLSAPTTLGSGDVAHNILAAGGTGTITFPSTTATYALDNISGGNIALAYPTGSDFPNTLYNGQQVILSGDGTGYWRTVASGTPSLATGPTLLGSTSGPALAQQLTPAQVASMLTGQSSTTLANGADNRFKGPPQNVEGSSYTLTINDAGGQFYYNSGSAGTLTIPANASVGFPVVTKIDVVNDCGNGTLTIAIAGGDTLVFLPSGATGSRTLTACGEVTLTKVGSTRWLITGVNLS